MKMKVLRKLLIFTIIIAWFLSGWPQIWQNPSIPPKILKVNAAITDTYYGTYDIAHGSMINITGAETRDDTQYAHGDKNTYVVIENWSGTAGSGEITGVRIYCEHYATTPDGNDFTLVNYSLDDWLTTGTTTGQQVMPASETSFSVDITADKSPWTWTDIGNLEVRATAKASAKQNFTEDYIEVLYIQVDYTQPPIISVVITTDGTITYGPVEGGQSKSTIDLTDTQTAQNDGGATENFNIMTSNAINGTSWTIGSSAGNNVFVHEFSTNSGGDWTKFTAADSYQALTTGVEVSGTVNFDLRITVPTDSDSTQKNITITIQAVAP